MKSSSAVRALVLLLGVASLGDAARVVRGVRGRGSVGGSGAGSAGGSSSAAVAMQSLVHNMLSGEGGVQMKNILGLASRYVDPREALLNLAKRNIMPQNVSMAIEASFLKANNSEISQTNKQTLDEKSLTKARAFLNAMVEKAQKELDDKVIEAKEFEARNRGSQAQVVADISRLGSQIADQMGLAAGATSGIAESNRKMDEVRQQRKNEQTEVESLLSVNFADMTVKQNDLDVFDFLIKATKKICDAQSFIQGGHIDHHVQVCSSDTGGSLRFSDIALQAKFDKLLSKASHDILDNALYQVRAKQSVNLLQAAPLKGGPTAVLDGQREELGNVKCGPIPDCGLLYDTLSLQWGGFKDQVDELKKNMDKNAANWASLKADFNAQLNFLTGTLAAWTDALSTATAAKNADMETQKQKEEEKRILDGEHTKEMRTFRERIQYIVQQDICGPTVIRNEVMKESTDCHPKDIDDCDVTPWTPMACTMPCDDLCPDKLNVCSGIQVLMRDVVVPPNACGIKCPVLTLNRKCNQFKCPVDCLLSQWTGFSKCSKDCEGGVQERTRSILTKPKNGGNGCTAVSDGRPCNTGSCDRDCTLEDWTTWSPCSMACNSGNQERKRVVDIPIRGGGKCPRTEGSQRLEMQDCNVQPCAGDEVCIANQDLIIAVDASGSVNTKNWKLVKNFTGQLLKRYEAEYYGLAKVQIGFIEFGNGAIEEDGTISKALLISELSSDIAATKEACAAMEHQKGFTNMAQSFILAEKLLMQNGRKDAQSAIMTISDGKPSFLFETSEKAKELDDKGIMKFMVGIARFPRSDAWELMKSLASKPADTNTVRVPGFDALQDGAGPFVQEALAKFCPQAHSPSQTLEKELSRGYMLVREEGYCGKLGAALHTSTFDSDECYRLAVAAGATGFSMGRSIREGKCCVETLEFTDDTYRAWQQKPEDPDCPPKDGGFHSSRYYDWYAIEPVIVDVPSF